jgi:DNA-binding Xre family transcriptional regulator
MARGKGRAGIVDGQVIATITDKFGEDRRVVQRGSRIRIANTAISPILAMNREAAVIIGGKIRDARIARGFTLEELAIRVGITSGWPKNRMYEIESGPRAQGVRIGTLYAIAAALNIEVAALLPSVAEVLARTDVGRVPSETITILNNKGRVVA